MGNSWLLHGKRVYIILILCCLTIIPITMILCLGLHYFTTTQCFMIIFTSILVLAILGTLTRSYQVYQKQEKELQMYRMYTKPMEELVREVRARQHEFDNHLNAILNMHIMIDNYDELVKSQHDYIFSVVDDKKSSYLPLLRISDKILAGFLYTKIVSVKKNVEFDIEVGSRQIMKSIPESELIEVIGTLIDNAIEACTEDKNRIRILLTSINDKLDFEVMNEHKKIPLTQLMHFFEKGYSTKSNRGRRGLGLYNARRIIREWKGDITVENRSFQSENYVCFRIEV